MRAHPDGRPRPGRGEGDPLRLFAGRLPNGLLVLRDRRPRLRQVLSAGEIIAQVLTARLGLGWRFHNIVFMGMGEPLDNAEEVFAAIEVLLDRCASGFAQDRITICTAGHVEGLRLLAGRPWKRINLSVSLNAASDELRSRIMPIDRRWPLAELSYALRDYPKRRNFVLGLNYCLVPGLNDSPADVERLAAFCEGLGRVLVNLIPYNPGSKPIGRAPGEDEIEAFTARLLASGLRTRRRATRGRSIMAACGHSAAAAERGRGPDAVDLISIYLRRRLRCPKPPMEA